MVGKKGWSKKRVGRRMSCGWELSDGENADLSDGKNDDFSDGKNATLRTVRVLNSIYPGCNTLCALKVSC